MPLMLEQRHFDWHRVYKTKMQVRLVHSKTVFEMGLKKNAFELGIFPGCLLGKCHTVVRILRRGGFGLVCLCLNNKTGEQEAIKVNRIDVTSKAKSEIHIWNHLRCLDPDTCNIVRCDGFFFDGDRTCLKFELLDSNLWQYLSTQNYERFPIRELKPIIQQLATTLHHLKSVGIVHADLKPANIMVVNTDEEQIKVKVIDFGNSQLVHATSYDVPFGITSYTAPEVALRVPFDETIDMWSLGVTVAELATGDILYPCKDPYHSLAYIIDMQGQPADYLLDRGEGTGSYFNAKPNGDQRWEFKTYREFAADSGYDLDDDLDNPAVYEACDRNPRVKSLDDLVLLMDSEDCNEKLLLLDLIKRMLHLDPEQRIKPLEVLQHPLFGQNLPQSSNADSCTNTRGTETSEVSQLFSSSQTAGPQNCRLEVPTVSLASELADNTAEEEVLSETDAAKNNWFQSLFSKVQNTFRNLWG